MTSFRQIYANRRNARKSTGPRIEEGKQRSRCNAVRHGLTAETVIGALEDFEDYQAFETTITNAIEAVPSSEPNIRPTIDPTIELARCFLRLANLPNFVLDRVSRYEATPWQSDPSCPRCIGSPQTTREKTNLPVD
jgi:hypothetical protein